MKERLVSIIMPVYNTNNYLKEAIQSIIKQTYKNWELIIINDGSTDNCLKTINIYINDKIKLINFEKNKGTAIARNAGIDMAKGTYIAFLDSDDIWKADKLRKQIKFMERENADFSFSAYDRISEDAPNLKKIVKVPYKIEYIQALKNTIILTSTVIINIEKINKEEIKMPNIKIAEDTATWYNILRNGKIAYGYNESLVQYRCRKNSLSANKIKSIYNLWQVYKKYEKLNFIQRTINILCYIKNATIKRFYIYSCYPNKLFCSFIFKKKENLNNRIKPKSGV